MLILDSDHCVAILRARLDLTGRVAPDEDRRSRQLALVSWCMELPSRSAADNLARLDVLMAALTILPYDEWSARRFGQLKAQLEQDGAILSDLDLQIASITLEHEAVLVTHNQRHFSASDQPVWTCPGRLARLASFPSTL